MSFLVALPEQLYSRTAFGGFSEGSKPNLATARAMMWTSQLAYESGDPTKIANISRLWGLDTIRPFMQQASSRLPMSKTHGLVATKGGSVIITFAGTDPLVMWDWVADLRSLTSANGVHEGFRDALNAAWTEIKPAIEDAASKGRSLFLTGHSLGGALAVVAAERAVRQEQLIGAAQIYTFGMPRVGTEEFVKRYGNLETTTYRFVHGQDAVPEVPPEALGFRHVGRPLECQSGGIFAENAFAASEGGAVTVNEPSSKGLLDRLRSLISTSPAFRSDLLGRISEHLPQGIGDHLPDRYLHALGSTN